MARFGVSPINKLSVTGKTEVAGKFVAIGSNLTAWTHQDEIFFLSTTFETAFAKSRFPTLSAATPPIFFATFPVKFPR
jgi:hypothetical protein